jgi:hypothetical protein
MVCCFPVSQTEKKTHAQVINMKIKSSILQNKISPILVIVRIAVATSQHSQLVLVVVL